MSIDKIKAAVSAKGLFSPERYKVEIWSPVGELTEDDLLYCSAPTLPGRGFSTIERFDHGPIRKIPYSELYNDISLTFYNSRNLKEWEFFNDWQEFIGGKGDYYLPYYDEIVGKIHINALDRSNTVQKTIGLFEAYPVTLSEISMGYDQGGDVSTFNVDFAFHHFEVVSGYGAVANATPTVPEFPAGEIADSFSPFMGGMGGGMGMNAGTNMDVGTNMNIGGMDLGGVA